MYRKVEVKIWNDEKFLQLSPLAKLLFFYLMTCPHGNLAGIYALKKGYATDDMKCTTDEFDSWMKEISDLEMAKFDDQNHVLWICNHIEYNPFPNRNVMKNAAGYVSDLPKSPLIGEFADRCEKLPAEASRNIHVYIRRWLDTDELSFDDKPKAPPEEKSDYGEGVFLTETEFKRLEARYGYKIAREMIQKLGNYKATSGKQYVSDYKVMVGGWMEDRFRKDGKLGVKDQIDKSNPNSGGLATRREDVC